MSESAYLTYYQRNRDLILNRAKDYYENDKERLRESQEINTETYLNKEKTKKREYWKNWYLNMSEEKKKKTKRIPKKFSWAKKGLNIIMNKIAFLIMI